MVRSRGLGYVYRRQALATVVGALAAMPAGTDAQRLNRVRAAVLLVMACPEYLVQK